MVATWLWALGITVVLTISWAVLDAVAKSRGINLLSALKKGSKNPEKEKKKALTETKLDKNKEIRLIYPEKNFSEIIEEIVAVGKDPATGLNILEFGYGDGKRTDFQVLDSLEFLHPRDNPSKAIKTENIPVWEITSESLTQKKFTQITATKLRNRYLEKEILDAYQGASEISQKFLEYQKSMRRASTGYYPQTQDYGRSSLFSRRRTNSGFGGDEFDL